MPIRKDHAPWSRAEGRHCATLAEQGISAKDTAAHLNVRFHGGRPVRSEGAVSLYRTRNRIHVKRVYGAPAPPILPEVQTQQQVERRETDDGITLLATGQRIKTVDDVIRYAKIDLTKFAIAKQEASTWDTTVKDQRGRIKTVQNFRVFVQVKPKAGPNVAEQVEAIVKGGFRPVKPLPRVTARVTDAALLQAVVIADPHIGKYAWDHETGHGDYDIGIATRLLRESCAELLAWGDRERVAARAIWLLGDVFHYDTPNGATTGGTPLDRDGRVEKMLSEGTAALCDVIEASAARGPTAVVLVPGNHDAVLTLALRQILTARFRTTDRVTVDTRGTTRKYVTHGHCLIGLAHGDKAQKRLHELMAVEAREAWGQATYKEIHHGHLHSDAAVSTVAGVTVRQHAALCPPDGWHALEGYVGAPRRMWSFVYSAAGGDGGLVGMRASGVTGG